MRAQVAARDSLAGISNFKMSFSMFVTKYQICLGTQYVWHLFDGERDAHLAGAGGDGLADALPVPRL